MKNRFPAIFLLAVFLMPAAAAEPESDSKIYMEAAMARSTLSQCLLVGKAEGKQAQKAYDDWLAPRKDAVKRVAAQGCGQICQMLGDPLQPLRKPPAMPGAFALSPTETEKLCRDGMSMTALAPVATEPLPDAQP